MKRAKTSENTMRVTSLKSVFFFVTDFSLLQKSISLFITISFNFTLRKPLYAFIGTQKQLTKEKWKMETSKDKEQMSGS